MALSNEEIDIKIKANVDATSVGDFKKSLKDLNSLLLQAGDVGTTEYKKVAKAIGDANDRMNDLKTSTKQLSGEPMENLLKGFNGIKDSILNMDLKGFKTSLSTVKTSFMELSATMLANPIFLLAAVIGGIVVALYSLKDIIPGVGKVFKDIGAIIDYVVQGLKDFTDGIGLTNFAAKKAAQETVDAQKKATEAINDRYDLEIRKAQAAGKETIQIEIEKTKAVQKSVDLQIQSIKDLAIANGELNTEQQKDLDDLIKKREKLNGDLEVLYITDSKAKEDKIAKDKEKSDKEHQVYLDRLKEKKKAQEDYNKELSSLTDQYILDDRQRLEKKYDDDLAIIKGAGEKELEIRKAIEEDKKAALEKFDLDAQKRKDDQKAKDDKDAADKLQKEYDDYIKSYNQKKAADDLLNQEIADNRKIDIDLMNDYKITQEQIDNSYNEAQIRNAKITYAEFNKLYRQDVENHQTATQKKAANTKMGFDIAKGLASALNAIGDLMFSLDAGRSKKTLEERNRVAKKEFNIKKGLGLVNAGINMAVGIAAAATETPFLPLGLIHLITAATTGTIALASIAAQKFNPESASDSAAPTPNIPSAGAGGDSTPQTPAFQAPTFMGLGQNNLIGGAQTKAEKVYVVESDITSTQRRVSTIEGRSVLGG